MRLINSIVNRNFVEADSILSETVELIMARKLEEAKKMTAAKMCEQPHMMNRTSSKLRSMDIAEEDKPHQLNALEKIKDAEVTRKVNKLTDIKDTLNSTDKALNVLGVKSDSADSNKIQGQINSIRKTRPYNEELNEKKGLWDNIHAKRKRIKGGSGERMRKPGSEGAPSEEDLKNSQNEETLEEARVKIVKARIRGGKIQRRKKVSNVAGMTLRGGKLQRMSPAERRRRKMGARKAVRKRKGKMTRILMKRQRSLRKRKALGL